MERYIELPGHLAYTLLDDSINLGCSTYRLQHYKHAQFVESKWSSCSPDFEVITSELSSQINLLLEYINKILYSFRISVHIYSDGIGFMPIDESVETVPPVLHARQILTLSPELASAIHFNEITLRTMIYDGFLLGKQMMSVDFGTSLRRIEGNLSGHAVTLNEFLHFSRKDVRDSVRELNNRLEKNNIKISVNGYHHMIELL